MAERGAVVAAGAVNAAGAAGARGKEPCWGFWDGRRGNISLGKTGAAGEGGGDGLLGLTGGVRLEEHSEESVCCSVPDSACPAPVTGDIPVLFLSFFCIPISSFLWGSGLCIPVLLPADRCG